MSDPVKKDKSYMPPLDGIRGLACLFVVASHIFSFLPIRQQVTDITMIGSFGVIIFFSLSGFLMSTLYCDRNFNIDQGLKYLVARMSRIAPAYYVAVIFCWLLYLVIPNFEYQMTPLMMVRSFLFGGNQGVHWSIPPEVQFYVYFLFLWLAVDAFSKGKAKWLSLAIILTILFAVTKTLWGGLMLPSKLHIFICGFLAAFLVKHEPTSKVISAPAFQLAILASIATYFVLELPAGGAMYKDMMMPILVSLGVASLSSSSKVTHFFETDTMRLMGAASFSIYLFHDPLLHMAKDLGWLAGLSDYATIAVLVVLSLAPAVAFYFLLERRMNAYVRHKVLDILGLISKKEIRADEKFEQKRQPEV